MVTLLGIAACMPLNALLFGNVTKTEGTDSPATSIEAAVAKLKKVKDEILGAARQGDAVKTAGLIHAGVASPLGSFDEESASLMLATLLQGRELNAFLILHDKLKETTIGRDWKISDDLLITLARENRTDFLDGLLARRLDLKKLQEIAEAEGISPTAKQWIIRRVAEVAKERENVDAMGAAAAKGDLMTLQRLLEAGTDINGVGKDNNTPLIRAVFKNQIEAAKFLIEHGADVNKPRFPGWDYSPLCLVKSVEMADLLRKSGADIHAKLWKRDVSILVYVANYSKADVVAWFLEQGLDPKMMGDNQQNLLFGLKDPQTAKILLEAGVDPNHIDEFGKPPIASARTAEVAQVLIDHGAKLTGLKEPLLPLMIHEASAGAVDVVLKAQGKQDQEVLQQALIRAAHSDKGDTAQILINHGAKPNEPGIWNSSGDYKAVPLMICSTFGSEKTAKVLLEAGADPNGGETPGMILKTAMQNGYKGVAELLKKAGAHSVSELSFAVSMQDEEKIKELLSSSPTFEENSEFWDDVMSNAARKGDLRTIQEALRKGVPPDRKAFYAAAFEGQHEALALLLAVKPYGSDPTVLRSALESAAYNSHPYNTQRAAEHFEKCVEMLLAAGALKGELKIVLSAVFTRNPGGNPKVIEMLVRAGADPNPPSPMDGKPDARLLDLIKESCDKGYCSKPSFETVLKMNELSVKP